jgi:hypothetical protein
MKSFVFGFLLLAAVIAAVGAYRGWFTVDQAKIQQDEESAKTELYDIGQKVKEKTSDRKGPVNEQ